MISVFSDGASGARRDCPGGYGWIVVKNNCVLAWGYGGSKCTTNNRMELEGAIQGLRAVMELQLVGTSKLELVCDSRYVLGIANGTSNPSKNVDLAQQIRDLAISTRVNRFRWVRGHGNDIWNNRCDLLAAFGKKEHSRRG